MPGTTTLIGSASCTIRMRFLPTSAGDVNVSLSASASPGGAPTLALSGTGQLLCLLRLQHHPLTRTPGAGPSLRHFFDRVTETGNYSKLPVGLSMMTSRERGGWLIKAVVFASAHLGGCGGGADSSPASFIGVWQSTAGSVDDVCTPPQPSAPFESFDIGFQAGTSTSLELVELDASDQPLGSCVYRFGISGRQASLAGAQTCTTDLGAGPMTTVWSRDVFTLSADGQALDEVGADETTTATSRCNSTLHFHYQRKPQ